MQVLEGGLHVLAGGARFASLREFLDAVVRSEPPPATAAGRDETCPVSTGGGTRRVRSVREEGRGVSTQYGREGEGGRGAATSACPCAAAGRAAHAGVAAARGASSADAPANACAPARRVQLVETRRVQLVREGGTRRVQVAAPHAVEPAEGVGACAGAGRARGAAARAEEGEGAGEGDAAGGGDAGAPSASPLPRLRTWQVSSLLPY